MNIFYTLPNVQVLELFSQPLIKDLISRLKKQMNVNMHLKLWVRLV